MIKTIIWGFCGKIGKAITDELQKKLDIIEYFSDQENSLNIWPFLLGDIPEAPLNPEALKLFQQLHQQYFETYQVMITRRGVHFSDYHELSNEFSLCFHYFYHLIKTTKPELIIFSNLPHEGPDFVLYHTAQLLGIKTLMTYQSLFPNKFYSCTQLNDFGYFKNTAAIFNHPDTEKEITEKPKLFYMKSVERLQAQEKANLLEKLKYKSSFIKQTMYSSLQRLKDLKNNTNALNIINLSKKLAQRELNKRYLNTLQQHNISRQHLDNILQNSNKIVYFPLHLQPELTTSALGGIFQDQIYAIETLSALLGNQWTILVKENPKQSYFQRRKLFFKRLVNIPNTYLVDKLFPSQVLMENSQLVATITGTAGWETIKRNNKCLIFGQAWYASLENCFIYDKHFDKNAFFQFLQNTSSFDDLKTSFEILNNKAGHGVIDIAYMPLVENFDLNINGKQVSQSLQMIIEHPDTQWGKYIKH